MRITIINDDKFVRIDNSFYYNNNISELGVPENIHALQWNECDESNSGHIEYKFIENIKPQNEEILSLPNWAISCIKYFLN